MVKRVKKSPVWDDDLGVKVVDAEPNETPRVTSKRYSIYGGYSIIRSEKTTIIKTEEQKAYVVVNGVVYKVEDVF